METRQWFTVLRPAFPPDHVAHSGQRHEVTFITRVDELAALEHPMIVRLHAGDRRPVPPHRLQRLSFHHRHARLPEQLGKGVEVGVRLGVPHEPAAVAPRCPGEELPRVSADRLHPTGVGAGQAARHHSPDPGRRFDDHHRCPFPRRRHSGDDAGGSRPENHHVVRHRSARRRSGNTEQQADAASPPTGAASHRSIVDPNACESMWRTRNGPFPIDATPAPGSQPR
jgi:hypothetical protein